MEATLKYNLPEEQDDFYLATNGYKFRAVLWDMDQWLRGEIKYNDNLSDDTYNAYRTAREQLREYMNEMGVSYESE